MNCPDFDKGWCDSGDLCEKVHPSREKEQEEAKRNPYVYDEKEETFVSGGHGNTAPAPVSRANKPPNEKPRWK